MEDDDDGPRHKHDDVHSQVSGTGLQCFAVQSLVFTEHTHCSNLQVGESDAGDGGAHKNHRVAKAVYVIDEDALTGQLEQGGVVTEWVEYNPPAAGQADAEAHKDQHHH